MALLGSLLSLGRLHHRLAALLTAVANPKAAATAAMGLFGPYSFSAAAIMLTGLLVSFFYCVGALYG